MGLQVFSIPIPVHLERRPLEGVSQWSFSIRLRESHPFQGDLVACSWDTDASYK